MLSKQALFLPGENNTNVLTVISRDRWIVFAISCTFQVSPPGKEVSFFLPSPSHTRTQRKEVHKRQAQEEARVAVARSTEHLQSLETSRAQRLPPPVHPTLPIWAVPCGACSAQPCHRLSRPRRELLESRGDPTVTSGGRAEPQHGARTRPSREQTGALATSLFREKPAPP